MARGPRVVPFPAAAPAWRALLRTDGRGRPIVDYRNAMIALRNDPGMAFAFAFDEMEQASVVLAAPPICPDTEPGAPPPRLVTPEDINRLHEWLQHMALPKIGRENVEHALELFARERSIHPLRDWLRTRPDAICDGRPIRQPVLENWFSYALGCPNDAYHRQVGQMWAIAMVARIMQPGCQADYMLVLEGPVGGELKSTFCRNLAGDKYFSDHLPPIDGDQVRTSMHMRGKWLVEVPELAAFTRVADWENLKAFITRREEIYTPKYGRKERREPRQCLLVGTTNDDNWIKGAGGSRRFWPVRVGGISLDWLAEYRDQLFAEAVQAYDAGAPWWPDPNFERRVIAPQQEKRQWYDALTERVNEVIDPLTEITMASLGAQLGFDNVKFHAGEQGRVAKILKKAGWSNSMGSNGRMIWRKPE